MGYATKLADLSKGDKNHEIYRTGDLAYRDNDNFFIYGRIGRNIKIFGNRVNLSDLENNILDLGFNQFVNQLKRILLQFL